MAQEKFRLEMHLNMKECKWLNKIGSDHKQAQRNDRRRIGETGGQH